ncbi:MAG: M56 family metallopeptidase, partial [Streptosporangiaceae bacterium]
MTGGVILAAYALAAGFGAPAALCRSWARRSPRIATGLWLTLAASWLTAVPLAALTLLTPTSVTWQASGSRAAGTLSGTPGGTPVAAAGILLAAAVALRPSWHLARGLGRTRREHRAHAAFLAAAGRPDQALGAVILDDDAPAAYCLPRGRHQVVISSGALSRLSPGQLRAVLAHERAHLRGHHHLMLAIASALARAFPAIPLLARASAELAVLAEMTADAAAARRHDPADLAAALVTLAAAGSRTTALAAGGSATIARIQRLLAPPPQPRLPARTARLAAGAAALTIPAAIACLPLAIAACGIIARA